MAYNHTGSNNPYQPIPEQQPWSAHYGQSGSPTNQQPHHNQYQQQLNRYVRPAQAIYSDYQPVSSTQNVQQSPQQQQYGYQPAAPQGQYSSTASRYQSSGSLYGTPQQVQRSPQQSYSISPQQQNQYAQAYNHQVSVMPQRQLSYSVPHQHVQMQAQTGQSPSDVNPGYHAPQFQGYPESPIINDIRYLPNHARLDTRQAHSPIGYSQRLPPKPSNTGQPPTLTQSMSSSPRLQSNTSPEFVAEQRHLGPSPAMQKLPVAYPTPTASASPKPSQRVGNHAKIQPPPGAIAVIGTQAPELKIWPQSQIHQTQGQAIVKPSVVALPSKVTNSTQSELPTEVTMPKVKPQPPSGRSPLVNIKPDATLAEQSVTDEPTITKLNTPPLTRILPEHEPSEQITDIDYALLLLDLADEYFDAAYGKATADQPAKREPDLNVFHKLIATGLGCWEVVLRQWRQTLQPAVEAAVRLRYASILYEETDNTSDAEECLSKGIAQCDKLRLYDFKYNMQHLLARITFTTNARAAGVYLDNVVRDAEVQKHWPWVYAFRFLRASLCVAMHQYHETLQALHHLRTITSYAKSRGDIAIAAAACAIEAIVHITRATTNENIDQAQAALATVRTAENNPSFSTVPQITIMAYFVDLLCSLFKAETEAAHSKMKAMHAAMDHLFGHASWARDGSFLIPLSKNSAQSIPGTSSYGAVVSGQSERTYIKLSWLSKNELYALGNLLGASALVHKYHSNDSCEEFLNNAEGYLELAEEDLHDHDRRGSIEEVTCHLRLLRIFTACVRSAWADARKQLNRLKTKMAEMKNSPSAVHQAFVIYLEGVIAQGTGDTNRALALYSNPSLALKENSSSKTPIHTVTNDLAILATMNTILIIQRKGHPQQHRMGALLERIEEVETTSPSLSMRGALYYLRALNADASLDRSTNPTLTTKENLSTVLRVAKDTGVTQLSIMGLTFMSDRFFAGIVSPQANQMVTVSHNLATKARSDLWTSVTLGYKAACLETKGDVIEADRVKKEALHLAARLPVSMQVADSGKGS